MGGKKRNPKTGRFAGKELGEPSAEKIDEIIGRFVAAAGPKPRRDTGRLRWAVAVGLATAVVAGSLIGAAAKDWELGPTIHSLKSELAGAVDTGSALARSDNELRHEVGELQDLNTRLLVERGGSLQAMGQYRATDRAAVRDLRRADSALQYDQSVDRVSDRAKTWVALRAVRKAEKRLNETH